MKKIILILLLFTGLTACTAEDQKTQKVQEYIDRAETYFEQEDYYMTMVDFDRALSLAEKEYGEQSKEAADVRIEYGLHSTTYKEALEYVKSGEAIFKKLEDNEGLVDAYMALGTTHERRNEPELAREAYEEALKYCDLCTDDMSREKFDIYLGLSGRLLCSDEEALQYGEEAVTLIDKLPESEKNQSTVAIYYSIGNNHYRLNQYKEAVENYEKAIECWRQNKEGAQNYIALSYDFCGNSYAAIGNYEKAIENINQSLKMSENIKDGELSDRSIAYYHLAVIYTADEIQDYEKSIEYGIKACQVYTKQKDLSLEELEDLKYLKEGIQRLYDKSPMADQQDFETWYQEHCKR